MNYEEKLKLQKEKDAARVENTLLKLSEYWRARPHLRLGQIVTNAWTTLPEYTKNPEPETRDVFFLADDRLLAGISNLEKTERESTSKRSTDS